MAEVVCLGRRWRNSFVWIRGYGSWGRWCGIDVSDPHLLECVLVAFVVVVFSGKREINDNDGREYSHCDAEYISVVKRQSPQIKCWELHCQNNGVVGDLIEHCIYFHMGIISFVFPTERFMDQSSLHRTNIERYFWRALN